MNFDMAIYFSDNNIVHSCIVLFMGILMILIVIVPEMMSEKVNSEKGNEVPDWENKRICLGKKITGSNEEGLLSDSSFLYVPGTSIRDI